MTKYYWDSAVYLAWLNEEKENLSSILAILQDNRDRKNFMFTSTITLIEVLESKMMAGKGQDFHKAFDGYHHSWQDVSYTIAEKARFYRDYYLEPARRAANDGRILLTQDAIHLATAFVLKADEFHTFDAGKKKGPDDDGRPVKGLSLLSLTGNVAGDNLTICKPYKAGQHDLFPGA